MKVGIMQPYLFPYIGYFQLIHAVDAFVIHDDVQYIKGGWINRNRIQVNNRDYLFTFSLKKASSLKNINMRLFSDLFFEEKTHFLKLLQNNYKKAPYFLSTHDLIKQIFDNKEIHVVPFITNSFRMICKYLKIETPFFISSELKKNNKLRNQERVIDICKILGANIYINPIGGRILYSKDVFKKRNISLYFLEPRESIGKISYRPYIPNLSMIDIMMFHSAAEIKSLLTHFNLI